jgi:hypothetical protein
MSSRSWSLLKDRLLNDIGPLAALPNVGVAAPPAAPAGLSKVALDAWAGFWRSPVSQAVDRDADMPALHRWIEAVNDRERIVKVVRKQPLVDGSKGQPTLNPLVRMLADLESNIRRAEGQASPPLGRAGVKRASPGRRPPYLGDSEDRYLCCPPLSSATCCVPRRRSFRAQRTTPVEGSLGFWRSTDSTDTTALQPRGEMPDSRCWDSSFHMPTISV